MLPPVEELKTTLESLLPGVALTVDGTALLVQPKDLIAVARCLKDTERFAIDYVGNLTAVDYPPEQRIDVVSHLYSMAKRHGPITLKVRLDRNRAAMPSLTPLWRAAEYQEREAYDLFGVTFEGHPDLRRILMWDGFKGHPMRKDYVPEDQNELGAPQP